jgi:molybdate transport system substrate-binding protein
MKRLLWLTLAILGCRSREPSLVVFAASSLKEPFEQVTHQFQTAQRSLVSLHFAGTQELCTQLEHGARADVLASADELHMARMVRQGLVKEPVVFAENDLVLLVSAEARHLVTSLRSLSNAQRIVVGNEDVPIGRYTASVLERAEALYGAAFRATVTSRVVSKELSVRQVVARVVLGEAEAGFVYRSDARNLGDAGVVAIELPSEVNVVARYPIAVALQTQHPSLAEAFLQHLRSSQGRRALLEAGFTPSP